MKPRIEHYHAELCNLTIEFNLDVDYKYIIT